jgi:hypothetical protein
MSKIQQPISPRGLDVRQAAAYLGVAPKSFRKMIRLGLALKPLALPGMERQIWDLQQLDAMITAARASEQRVG